jgi:hypothetical protein
MCNDQVWEKLMQAAASGSDFQTDRIGISYMLQGDRCPSWLKPWLDVCTSCHIENC